MLILTNQNYLSLRVLQYVLTILADITVQILRRIPQKKKIKYVYICFLNENCRKSYNIFFKFNLGRIYLIKNRVLCNICIQYVHCTVYIHMIHNSSHYKCIGILTYFRRKKLYDLKHTKTEKMKLRKIEYRFLFLQRSLLIGLKKENSFSTITNLFHECFEIHSLQYQIKIKKLAFLSFWGGTTSP